MTFEVVLLEQLGFVRMIGFCEALIGMRPLREVFFYGITVL
jgi:hypothetical protein